MTPESHNETAMGLELMAESDESRGQELLRRPHPLSDHLGLGSGSEAIAVWFAVFRHNERWSDWVAPRVAGAQNIRFVYEAAEDNWQFRSCPDAAIGSAGRCEIQWSWFQNLTKGDRGYRVLFVNQSDYNRIARFWIVYDY
jgi:hypothetical protein